MVCLKYAAIKGEQLIVARATGRSSSYCCKPLRTGVLSGLYDVTDLHVTRSVRTCVTHPHLPTSGLLMLSGGDVLCRLNCLSH